MQDQLNDHFTNMSFMSLNNSFLKKRSFSTNEIDSINGTEIKLQDLQNDLKSS